jgi:hypothetical protein
MGISRAGGEIEDQYSIRSRLQPSLKDQNVRRQYDMGKTVVERQRCEEQLPLSMDPEDGQLPQSWAPEDESQIIL